MNSDPQADIQVDPNKFIRQLEIQRNNALSQSAQCVAVIEDMQEQLDQVAEELNEAHRRLAEFENAQTKPKVTEGSEKP